MSYALKVTSVFPVSCLVLIFVYHCVFYFLFFTFLKCELTFSQGEYHATGRSLSSANDSRGYRKKLSLVQLGTVLPSINLCFDLKLGMSYVYKTFFLMSL